MLSAGLRILETMSFFWPAKMAHPCATYTK
jgi:hypothetical protein